MQWKCPAFEVDTMLDVVSILLVLLFFALTYLLLKLCEGLMEEQS